ncbi:MAG: hypothetical protein ACTSP8_09960 [Promethearchaeota archaeon]
MKKWIINIIYPPHFLTLFHTLQNRYKLYEIYEPKTLVNPLISLKSSSNQYINYRYQQELYNFLAGISYHEFGHSKECPIDSQHFSIIYQAVSTVLEQKKVFRREMIFYMVNLFTDLIVNTQYGLNTDNSFFRNSIFTFYFSELLQFDSTDLVFYFFVLTNIKLYLFNISSRDALETILLPKLPPDHGEILKKLVGVFCPYKKLAKKLILGVEPLENERWKIINYITERDNWGRMAYDLTNILFDFLSKTALEENQPIIDSSFIKKFKENAKFQKEVLDKIIERKYDSKRKGVKRKDIYPAIEKYPGELDLGKGLGTYNKNEIFDAIYRFRLKDIKINMPEAKKSEKNTIAWLNREIMTDKDNIMNFDPLYTFFLPNSDDLILYKKAVPLTNETLGSIQETGFPDLAIFCDDSGSMEWNPATGAGKYDALIITILSLFRWLEDKSFAPIIKYNFTFFSTTTRTSGWVDYYHLNDIKPLLYYHEGGGTKLNLHKFEEIMKAPNRKATILITDGEIFNSQDLFKIIKKHKTDLIFLFIQIGRLSKVGRNLKNNGFNVVQIKDIKKLSQIVLTFITDTYKQFT